MSAAFRGLAFIVPTRNRAALAIRSIASVIGSSRRDIRVLVSDNSTDGAERDRLKAYCDSLAEDARLTYVRPDEPLRMPEHWDWVLEQALERLPVDHFAVLTDRFVFRPGCAAELAELASRYPDHAIRYAFDAVYDQVNPCRLVLGKSSRDVFSIDSDDLLSNCMWLARPGDVPVLLNSLTTRSILDRVRSAFGSLCLSISPDFANGFRTLAIEEQTLYYHNHLTVNWARQRSNGMSMSMGRASRDHRDFVSTFDHQLRFTACPLPDVMLTLNAISHEYLTMREQATWRQLSHLDSATYIRALATEIGWMNNATLQSEYRRQLERIGAVDSDFVPSSAPWAPVPDPNFVPSAGQRLKGLAINENTRPIWWQLHRRLGLRLPFRLQSTFPNGEQALAFALENAPIPATTSDFPSWYRRVTG